MSDENQQETAEETAHAEPAAETPQEETPDQEKELTPEEYRELRDKAMEALKEEIPSLEIEEKYHKLKADIEEHKARELTMIARQAQFFAPPPGSQPQPQHPSQQEQPAGDPPSDPTPPKRPLKTD